jgi:hypothetical protein
MDDLESVIEQLKQELGEDKITTASDPKIKRPERALERQAIDDFMKRNPQADGGRIKFKDGPKKILTGEKFIEIAEKFPDATNQQLLDYFNKNDFVNRTGDPLSLGAIKTQKSKFFDITAEIKSKIPKGYIKSTDVFEKLPISKADYFRVKQAKEGGTLLTKEIDKLLKPVKIGETFYFKNPNKKDLKSFVRLADKTGRLDNRIADLMIEFDKVYGKNFAKGIVPDVNNVTERFNITDTTAGKVTTRLAQWYGGQDFKNTQLQNLKRNKLTSNRMFKTIEKSPFGNPYRQGLYEIALQTIDAKLGNKQGTFQNLKNQAKQILKNNKIPIYNMNMGKKAFGFNINEIAGVTGSAKSKAAEFSQFIDIMEGNLNQKALAAFQGKLSTARQIIENNPTKLSVESKKINKMAQNLEKKYGIELPRLRDPDATKYFSPARLRELKAQGLDIVKAAERAGYTVQMPKGALTVQEFVSGTAKASKQIAANLRKLGFKCKFAASSGGVGSCDDPMSYVDDIKKQEDLLKVQTSKAPQAVKTLNTARKLNAARSLFTSTLGPGALAFEAVAALPIAYMGYKGGKSPENIIADATFNLIGKSDKRVFLDKAVEMGFDTANIKRAQDFLKKTEAFQKQDARADEFMGPDDLFMYPQMVQKAERDLLDITKQFIDPETGQVIQERVDAFDQIPLVGQGVVKDQSDLRAKRQKQVGNVLQRPITDYLPNFAGGGIAGLSGGIDKGPQIRSMNPDSQGLSGLLKRGIKG